MIFKRFYFIVLILLTFFGTVSAQNISNISISGLVKDADGDVVPAATIMLLNISDSTLVNYTITNNDGNFIFKNVRNTGYLLKITYIGHMPLQITIPVSNVATVNLGEIKVEPIAEILMEVVIKSAQAPLFIHGDTVEYDARLFKVPPGSTVEDLLRRLPGIDVDASGNISSMGKDVRRIYVDGKTFFSDDPTTVTKNLDAEAIARVQVYNDKSEQERLTGIKDGSQDKVMNLELKDEFKKGQFGKATIAAGTEDRWATRGSFNRFNQKTQISFIGYGNNVNETGVNWDDYAEFKGNSAYSDYDNGDFGFGGGQQYGHRSFSAMGGNYDGKGFSKNAGAGVNYNYFDTKIKFNAGYFYNQSDLYYTQLSERQTFLPDTSFLRNDVIDFDQFNNAHTINSRFEMDIDSNNSVILRVNSRISGNLQNKMQLQRFQTPSFDDINNNFLKDSTGYNSFSSNILGLYSHKFKKKSGRIFAISGNADVSNNNSDQYIENLNSFFLAVTPEEKIKLLNENNSTSNLYKSSVMFVEPMGKRFSLMSFYNFSATSTKTGKTARNILSDNILVDSLCNYYKHLTNFNRIGTSLNFGYEGLNMAVGGAFQQIQLSGNYAKLEGANDYSTVSPRKYLNFTPNFSANLELQNNMNFSLEYEYGVNEPSLTQLQPVVTLSNPLYKIEGNLNLTPELSHDFSASFHYWNQASFTNFSLSGGYSINETSIVYNQHTEFINDLGYVTFSRPENIKGGNSKYAYFWSSLPIVKTILTTNISGQIRFSETPMFINNVENLTNTNYYSGKLGLNLTIGKKLSFSASGSISDNIVKYSIQTNQNQTILNYNYNAGIKWQFAKKSFFESNFSWSIYNNEKLNYNKDLMIVNASIRQLIGKKNRFEVRLAAFDLLNQRQYLQQYAAVNYTELTSAATLARYFMLSVSYNLKGFDTKMKKSRW